MRRRSTFSVISQCTINMPAHIRRVTWKRYHDVNAWQPDGLQRWEQIPRDSLWLSGKQKGQGLQQNRGRNVVNTCSKLAIADSDRVLGVSHKVHKANKMLIRTVYYLAVLISLKYYKDKVFLLCFIPSLLMFFLSPCQVLFLIRSGSLFDLTESCCSGSSAPRYQAHTPPSLTTEESSLFLTPSQKKKKRERKRESQALQPPSFLEIRHILPLAQETTK